MTPVAHIARVIGFAFTFTFRIIYISLVRFLYFKIFSASFMIKWLSPESAVSVIRLTFFLFITTYYDARCIVRYFSLTFHLFISLYGYITFMSNFYLRW